MAVHGLAAIKVGDKRYNTKKGASLKLGGKEGSPVMGDAGFADMQYEYVSGELNCTIIATEDISLEDITAIRKANGSFDSDNGKSYITENLNNGPLPELTDDGIKCTFYGMFKEV